MSLQFVFLILLVLTFGLFMYAMIYLLLFEYRYGTKNVKYQLRKMYDGEEKEEDDDFIVRVLSFINISENLRRYLLTTGLPLKPEEFILLWGATALILPLITFILNLGLSTMVLFFIVGLLLFPLMAEISKKKRLALFNKQLPEALVIIGNCLRSGFTFRHALARVSEDLPNPISEELKRVIREVNYGRKLEESLGELASRTNSAELEMINSAVTIQQRSGGNLAEIVEKVTETINDRINIRNQIRVLTTQGRYSGMLIGLLPVFLLIILTWISPNYMNSFFKTSIGKVMLVVSVILETTGFLLIQKIVNIKY